MVKKENLRMGRNDLTILTGDHVKKTGNNFQILS
jgi:hypothetical protein